MCVGSMQFPTLPIFTNVLAVFILLSVFKQSFVDTEERNIEYPQEKTKLIYYDCAHEINQQYLNQHVGKPILQQLTISVKIGEKKKQEKEANEQILTLPKEKYYMKIRGNWSKYPNDKINEICLTFVDKTKDENTTNNNKEDFNCDTIVNNPSSGYKVCYEENSYSIKHLFLYFSISKEYLEKLLSQYNIPIVVNADNFVIYRTNYIPNENKPDVTNLDLPVCYSSFNETPYYLGNVTFVAFPLNIVQDLQIYDTIHTKSFLTLNWEYQYLIEAKYLTPHNRLVFLNFRKDTDTPPKCSSFWDIAILGYGPSVVIHNNNKEKQLEHSMEFHFSNKKEDTVFIPFYKNDELKTEYNYLLCFFSDENDYQGTEIKYLHYQMNTTDSIVLMFLIIFIVIFLPLIFSLTSLCVLIKIKFLNIRLKKLKLLNRKDEIEENLRRELNLDEYEIL